MRQANYLFFALLICVVSFSGCGDIVPVWVGELSLDDYTLYHTDLPRELSIDITEQPANPLSLELEVTYDYLEIQRSDLPLFLAIQSEDEQIDFHESITLKEEGEWKGELQENEVDYVITQQVIDVIELQKGDYALKIYADDEKAEQIKGVVKIVARLYENEGGEE